MGNYEEAIKASLKSLELTDSSNEPYPGDFAVIAMSFLELGDQAKANEYRAKFLESKKPKQFENDEEVQSFSIEVHQLFD